MRALKFLMSDLRADGQKCFVCGPKNSIGLGLSFRIEDNVCKSSFTPGEFHCGYDGVTHGGIVFSVLDDVMANWIYLNGIRAYTAKCDIRYKDSLAIGTPVVLEGHCIKQRGRLIEMQGKMMNASTMQLVAETRASFMVGAKEKSA